MRNIRRLLLVDDPGFFRDALENCLRTEYGFDVTAFAGSKQACLSYIGEKRPDVLLLDLFLHATSALELVRAITTTSHEAKILTFGVAAPDLAYAERGILAGALGYVHTDSPVSELAAAAGKLCDGATSLPSCLELRLLERLRNPLCDLPTPLSDREREILRLTGQGFSPKCVAAKLDLSPKTVESYRKRLRQKLFLKDGEDLLRYAIRHQCTEWLGASLCPACSSRIACQLDPQ